MKYLLLLGFVGLASAVDINGVECPVTDGELDCPSCPSGDIVIPEGVTGFNLGAFIDCGGITSVSLPSTVTSIGVNAFRNTGLVSINFPAGLTSIEANAFQATDLTELDFSEVTGVLSIGAYAFSGCSKLTTITFPKLFTAGNNAFFDMRDELVSVTYLGGKWGYSYNNIPDCRTSRGCTEYIHGCMNKEKSNYNPLATVTDVCEDSTQVRRQAGGGIYDMVLSKLVHYEVAIVGSRCDSGNRYLDEDIRTLSECASYCFANRGGNVLDWRNEYNSDSELGGFDWKPPQDSPYGKCGCYSSCDAIGYAETDTIAYKYILKEGITDTDDYKVLVSGKCDYEIYDEADCKKALVDLQEVPSLGFLETGNYALKPSSMEVASCCHRGIYTIQAYWETDSNHCGPNQPSKKCKLDYPCICRKTDPSGVGCMDASACNYVAAATSAGVCTYPDTHYKCDGSCENDSDGDGVCNELEVDGCTDAGASNYVSTATEDDGSCVYSDLTCEQLETHYKLKCGCSGAIDVTLCSTLTGVYKPKCGCGM